MGLVYIIFLGAEECDGYDSLDMDVFFITLDKDIAIEKFNEYKNKDHKHIFRPRDKFELITDTESDYEFYLDNWRYVAQLREYKLNEEL